MGKKIRKVRSSTIMESSAPMNIPVKSWIKDSSASNSSSLSSSLGGQGLSSLPQAQSNQVSTHQAAQTVTPPPVLLPSTHPSAPAQLLKDDGAVGVDEKEENLLLEQCLELNGQEQVTSSQILKNSFKNCCRYL